MAVLAVAIRFWCRLDVTERVADDGLNAVRVADLVGHRHAGELVDGDHAVKAPGDVAGDIGAGIGEYGGAVVRGHARQHLVPACEPVREPAQRGDGHCWTRRYSCMRSMPASWKARSIMASAPSNPIMSTMPDRCA